MKKFNKFNEAYYLLMKSIVVEAKHNKKNETNKSTGSNKNNKEDPEKKKLKEENKKLKEELKIKEFEANDEADENEGQGTVEVSVDFNEEE